MVRPSIPETERVRRLGVAVWLADFLVSSMTALSDFGRFVILADVFRKLVALATGYGLGFLGLCLRIFTGNHRHSGNATGTGYQQEITAGKLGCWGFHHILLFTKRSACLNGEKSMHQVSANQEKLQTFFE